MRQYGWPYFRSEDEIRKNIDGEKFLGPIHPGWMVLARSAAVLVASVTLMVGLGSDFDEATVIALLLVEACLVVSLDGCRWVIRLVASMKGRADPNQSPGAKLFWEILVIGGMGIIVCSYFGSAGTWSMRVESGARILLSELAVDDMILMGCLILLAIHHLMYFGVQMAFDFGRRSVGLAANGGGWMMLMIITVLTLLLFDENGFPWTIAGYVLLVIKLLGQLFSVWAVPMEIAVRLSEHKSRGFGSADR